MDDDVLGRAFAVDGWDPSDRRSPSDGWVPTSVADPSHDWMESALCVSTTSIEFFPERGRRAAPAKAVCDTCVVRRPCLTYALQNEIVDGIWGGMSAEERVVLIGQTRRTARASGSPDRTRPTQRERGTR